MTADRGSVRHARPASDRVPRRGQAGVSPAGQGQPPGCRGRGGPAALPRDPGRLRPDRRTGQWHGPRDRRRNGGPGGPRPVGRTVPTRRGREPRIGRTAAEAAARAPRAAGRAPASGSVGHAARPRRGRTAPPAVAGPARPAHHEPMRAPGRARAGSPAGTRWGDRHRRHRHGRRRWSRSSRPPRSGRAANKATLGSTSYDGAEKEPFEPDWGGASWYGTTSGTYWTLNPKEYADPRKHGPEYQARARRGRRSDPAAPPPPLETVTDAGPVAPAREPSVEPEGGSTGPTVRRPTRRRRGGEPPTAPTGRRSRGRGDRRPSVRPRPAPDRRSRRRAAPGPRRPAPLRPRRPRPPRRAAPPVRRRTWQSTTASIRDWLEGGDAGLAGARRARRHRLGADRARDRLVRRRSDRLRPVLGDVRRRRRAGSPGSLQLWRLLLVLVAHPGSRPSRRSRPRSPWRGRARALLLSATGGATDVASGRGGAGRPAGHRLGASAWRVGVARELRRFGSRLPYPEAMPRRQDQRDLSAAAQEYLLALRIGAGAGDGSRRSRPPASRATSA